MKRMFLFLFIVAAAGCTQPIRNSPAPDGVVILKPEKSNMMPSVGTRYQLASNPRLFETHQPGPKEKNPSIAWALANEFVFRTALREQCVLPAERVVQHKTGIMVLFNQNTGKQRTSVFVRSDMKTIEWKR